MKSINIKIKVNKIENTTIITETFNGGVKTIK